MIPTAEEWLKNNYEANAINPNILIEFAKLHVTEALKQASESKSLITKFTDDGLDYKTKVADKIQYNIDSINENINNATNMIE